MNDIPSLTKLKPTESWNHRMVDVERGLRRSSGPVALHEQIMEKEEILLS